MGLILIRRPDLIVKGPLLAFDMLVGAIPVKTRVKLARSLRMRKLTTRHGAIGSVVAERHARMHERAIGVRAVGKESAKFFGLVC